jgi:NAD(P)-dependent dehydrogenase (short-subunit alcohol dehydrogenase family)
MKKISIISGGTSGLGLEIASLLVSPEKMFLFWVETLRKTEAS